MTACATPTLRIIHEPGHNGRAWSTDVLIESTEPHQVDTEASTWCARGAEVGVERRAHLALVALLRRLPSEAVAEAINRVVGHQALTMLRSPRQDGRVWQGRIGLELKRPGYPDAGLVRQLKLQMADRDRIGPDGTLIWLVGGDPPAAVEAAADTRCHTMRIDRLTDALLDAHDVADQEAHRLAQRAVQLLRTPLGTEREGRREATAQAIPRVHRLVLPVELSGEVMLVATTNRISDEAIWVNRRAAMDFLRTTVPLLDGRERLHPVADVLAAARAEGLLTATPPPPAGPAVLLTGIRAAGVGEQWLWPEVQVRSLFTDLGLPMPGGVPPVEVWATRPKARQRVYAAGDVVSELESVVAHDLLRTRLA